LRAIADIECCHKSDARRTDIKALGVVMMTVMEKDSQPKGSFGILHPERWSLDALDFLSKTECSTAEELAQVSYQMTPIASFI
jgi:hypothetical protein